MLTQEQKIILGKLDYYVAFFASALSARLTATFCELLVASMVTSEGLVTQSWIWGKLHNFWGNYHKWLETRYGAVKNTTLGLLAVLLPEESGSNRTLRGFCHVC